MKSVVAHPFFAPAIAVVIILIAMGFSLTLPGPKGAEAYHSSIRDVAMEMPLEFGQWEGIEQDIPRGSIKILRPNVAMRIQFRAEHHYMRPVEFLMIQCRDARDLAGHFPPECYPSVNGYVLEESIPREWAADGLSIPGMEYHFKTSASLDADAVIIYHFMILPDGRIVREMDEIYKAGADYMRRHHGAAQCQVFFGQQDLTDEDRDLAFEEIIAAHAPLIRAMGAAKDSP